jgi:carbamoyl-phosphate synthase large subunit
VLDKYGVRVIGVQVDAIERGEDRQAFKETMKRLGIEMPRSEIAYTVEEAEAIAAKLGYPVVIRPAYTMGGTGGGLVYNVEEFRTVVRARARGQPGRPGADRGVGARLGGAGAGGGPRRQEPDDHRLLHRERRRHGRPHRRLVLHRADADHRPELQQRLQKHSYDIVEAIEVIGGTNVQFAHDPKTGRVVVIEINPRTSRSSALASKATGFPIACLGAAGRRADAGRDPLLARRHAGEVHALGRLRGGQVRPLGLREVPRREDKLGTQMRAVGEVMSIGKTYKEALQKAIRSLENGRYGLGFAKDFHTGRSTS